MALASRELELVLIARNRASSTIARVGGALTALGAAIAGVGLAGTKAFISMAHEAAEFRQQAALTYTQVDNVANASLKSIEDATKRIAKTIPVQMEQVGQSFFDIFSTIDVKNMKEAEGMVELFAKAAVGGQAPMEDLGRATMAWMNALGETPTLERTAQLLAIQFELVRKGAGTYEEFAASVGKGIPAYVAAEQGVESFSGSLAFLTRNGLTAKDAVTSTARSIELIFSKKGIAGLNKLGVKLQDTEGHARDIVDILRDMAPYFSALDVEGRKKLFYDLFGEGRIQARRFFNTVLPNFEEFESLVNDMTEASHGLEDGTMDWLGAFDLMAEQPLSKLQLMKNQLEIIRVELGTSLFGVIEQSIGPALQKLIDWWESLSESQKKVIGETSLLAFGFMIVTGAAIAAVGALTLIFGVLINFPIQIAAAVAGLLGLGSALGAMGPGILKNWEQIKRRTIQIWAGTATEMKKGNFVVRERWVEMFDMISEVTDYKTPGIISTFKNVYNQWFSPIVDFWVTKWTNSFDRIRELFKEKIPGLVDKYIDEINTYGPTIVAAIGLIFGGPLTKIVSSATIIAEFDKVKKGIQEALRSINVEGTLLEVPAKWVEEFLASWKAIWNEQIKPKIESVATEFMNWWGHEGGKDFTLDSIKTLQESITNIIESILDAAKSIFKAIMYVFGALLGITKADIEEMNLDTMVNIDWEKLIDSVVTPIQNFLDIISNVFDVIAAMLTKDDTDKVKDAMEKIDAALTEIGPNIVDALFNLIEIPFAALKNVFSSSGGTGGWVEATTDQAVYRVLKILSEIPGLGNIIDTPTAPTHGEDTPTSPQLVQAGVTTPVAPDPSLGEQARGASIPLLVASLVAKKFNIPGSSFGMGLGLSSLIGAGAGAGLEKMLGLEEGTLSDPGAIAGPAAYTAHRGYSAITGGRRGVTPTVTSTVSNTAGSAVNRVRDSVSDGLAARKARKAAEALEAIEAERLAKATRTAEILADHQSKVDELAKVAAEAAESASKAADKARLLTKEALFPSAVEDIILKSSATGLDTAKASELSRSEAARVAREAAEETNRAALRAAQEATDLRAQGPWNAAALKEFPEFTKGTPGLLNEVNGLVRATDTVVDTTTSGLRSVGTTATDLLGGLGRGAQSFLRVLKNIAGPAGAIIDTFAIWDRFSERQEIRHDQEQTSTLERSVNLLVEAIPTISDFAPENNFGLGTSDQWTDAGLAIADVLLSMVSLGEVNRFEQITVDKKAEEKAQRAADSAAAWEEIHEGNRQRALERAKLPEALQDRSLWDTADRRDAFESNIGTFADQDEATKQLVKLNEARSDFEKNIGTATDYGDMKTVEQGQSMIDWMRKNDKEISTLGEVSTNRQRHQFELVKETGITTTEEATTNILALWDDYNEKRGENLDDLKDLTEEKLKNLETIIKDFTTNIEITVTPPQPPGRIDHDAVITAFQAWEDLINELWGDGVEVVPIDYSKIGDTSIPEQMLTEYDKAVELFLSQVNTSPLPMGIDILGFAQLTWYNDQTPQAVIEEAMNPAAAYLEDNPIYAWVEAKPPTKAQAKAAAISAKQEVENAVNSLESITPIILPMDLKGIDQLKAEYQALLDFFASKTLEVKLEDREVIAQLQKLKDKMDGIANLNPTVKAYATITAAEVALDKLKKLSDGIDDLNPTMTVTLEMIQKWNSGGGGPQPPGDLGDRNNNGEQEFEIPEMLPGFEQLNFGEELFGDDDPFNLHHSPSLMDNIKRGFRDVRTEAEKHRALMSLKQDDSRSALFGNLNGGNVDFNSMNRPQNYTIQFGDVITNATAEDIGQEIAWQVRTL